jgi:hypothetical protein
MVIRMADKKKLQYRYPRGLTPGYFAVLDGFAAVFFVTDLLGRAADFPPRLSCISR